MGRVTTKDIAKETGLSIATVSYVLNGKDNIPDDTKKRVHDADERYYNLAKERNLDGIIIVGVYSDAFYKELKTAELILTWRNRI